MSNVSSPELTSAEDSLIGAVLHDPSLFHDIALRHEHFLNPKAGAIWAEVAKRVNKNQPVDPESIADKLSKTCNLTYADVGHFFTQGAGSLALVPGWANLVRENWLRRSLSTVNAGLVGEPQQDLATVRGRLERLETSMGSSLPTLDSLLNPDYSRAAGLPSGLGISRISPSGIPKGRVTVVFGETGNFKSTVTNNIIWAMVNDGHKVLNVPLEDANELNSMRFLARATGIPYGKLEAGYLLTDDDKERIAGITPQFKAACANVVMGGGIAPDIDEIIRQARYHRRNSGIDAVVVDYLQCLEPPSHMSKKRDHEFTKYVMRRLQAAAKRENLAFILVNQIDKEASRRLDDPRPKEADMLGGSSVRQMSKLTIGVHRPALYYPEPAKKASHYTNAYRNAFDNMPNAEHWWKNLLCLYILKNVAGEPNVILHASVDPPTGVITPIPNIEDLL